MNGNLKIIAGVVAGVVVGGVAGKAPLYIDLKSIETTNRPSINYNVVDNNSFFQKGSMAALLSKGEAGSAGYNAFNRGSYLRGKPISLVTMTVGEIKKRQAIRPRSHPKRIFAVGMYQVIPNTLTLCTKKTVIKDSDFYDEKTQNTCFVYLAGGKRPRLQAYIMGKSNSYIAAGIDSSIEWRAIADPRTGKTYGDKGAKRNHSSITAKKWLIAMNFARAKYKKLINSGMSHKAAYLHALHTGK